jgi:hypothetical protein
MQNVLNETEASGYNRYSRDDNKSQPGTLVFTAKSLSQLFITTYATGKAMTSATANQEKIFTINKADSRTEEPRTFSNADLFCSLSNVVEGYKFPKSHASNRIRESLPDAKSYQCSERGCLMHNKLATKNT